MYLSKKGLSHEEISVFSWEETSEAFLGAFKRAKGVVIDRHMIDELNQVSYGHPYLMQVLGYYLIRNINGLGLRSNTYVVTDEDVSEVIPLARTAYERRALQPLIDELSPREIEYLKEMSTCLDESRIARTSEIARRLNKDIHQLSSVRASLIDNGTVASPQHGCLMFCIPYLADYVKSPDASNFTLDVIRQRRM